MYRLTRITFFIFICCLLLTDCKKKKQSEVVLEYAIPFLNNLEIDTTNVNVFVERESYDFPTNLDGELAKNNTNKSKIKSAKLVFMRIQIAEWATDSNHYSNFKDISEIEMDIKKTGIGQEKVAFKIIPDAKVNAINLDLNDVELKEYVKADNFKMVFRYKKRRAMPHELHFIISLRFRIIADPL